MSVLDFLWNGSPPPNVSSTTVNTPTLPDWYQTYLQGLMAKSNSIAGADFQTYGGPRVAGFTDDQKNAFEATRDNYGTGVELADQGATIARNAAGASSANALKPYIDKAGAMSQMGAAQPYITSAAGMSGINAGGGLINEAAGMSGMDVAQPMLNKATSIDQLAQAYPYLQASSNADSLGAADPLLQYGLSQSGASAALPYVAQGAQSFPTSADEYMNPYNQQVTDRIGALSARNLKENILPGINTNFIGAGQFGSSRQADFTQRAVRDANESALGQQAQVLQQGYRDAGQQFTADQARTLQAGQTLGGLTQGDASAALQAANTRGNLTATDAARQLSIGQTTGQLAGQNADRALSAAGLSGSLTNQDAARKLQAGTSLADITNQDALRQLQAAQLSGNFTGSDRSAVMDAGKSMADATNMDASRAITAGSTLGGLGQIRQNLGLRDAAALEGIGAQQQDLNQQNLTTAYNDFVEQRGNPAAQTQYLSSIFRGLAPPASTTSTNTGPGSSFQASPLAQLAGGLGTATALKSALGLKRGGRVKPMRKGGLASMRRVA